jgi:hypothetical protein
MGHKQTRIEPEAAPAAPPLLLQWRMPRNTDLAHGPSP